MAVEQQHGDNDPQFDMSPEISIVGSPVKLHILTVSRESEIPFRDLLIHFSEGRYALIALGKAGLQEGDLERIYAAVSHVLDADKPNFTDENGSALVPMSSVYVLIPVMDDRDSHVMCMQILPPTPSDIETFFPGDTRDNGIEWGHPDRKANGPFTFSD